MELDQLKQVEYEVRQTIQVADRGRMGIASRRDKDGNMDIPLLALKTSLILAAVSTVPPILFKILRKSKRFSSEDPVDVDIESLKSKYKLWKQWDVIISICLFFIFTPLFYLALLDLSAAKQNSLGDYDFLLFIGPISWVIPAFFTGLITCTKPTRFLYRFWLGEKRYEEFLLLGKINTDQKGANTLGVNTTKVDNYLTVILLVFCISFSGLFLDSYVLIKGRAFIVNKFFSFDEVEYDLVSDVSNVKVVRSYKALAGNTVKDPYYEITFKDGYTWKASKNLYNQHVVWDAMWYVVDLHGRAPEVEDPYPENEE